MNMTAFVLRNRHAVWALVVAIVILGVFAYREIPVRLFPDTAPPMVNVVTSWPGATAADVQREITDPLEDAFAAIENVVRTSATSQDNLSMIRIEFSYGTNARLGAVDVDNAVSRLASDLPADADRSRVLTFSTADRPIYSVGLKADDLLAARRIAENIVKPRLQSVEGVSAVDVFGGHTPTVLVDVDPAMAEAYKVSLPQIAGIIQGSSSSAPAGRLRSEASETMLRVDQRSERVEGLGDQVIPTADGGQIRLSSLATIYHGAKEDDSWFSIDGERSIALQVYRAENANTVDVVSNLQDAVAQLRTELPGMTLIEGEESGSFTASSVSNLLSNVWQALLLASIILFFFLGRAGAALVTAFTMPLAFGLTFVVMWMLGMEFNMVTLSAVILAVGMVVDSSVVVLENIIRHRDNGMDALDAARVGTDEVQLPVLAGAATTIIVLLPLLGLPGFVGSVFAPLATTLLIAFSSAVLVALILVPILSLKVWEGGRIDKIAASIARPFQWAMEKLKNGYLRLLDAGLRFRWVVLILATLAFALGIVGLRGAGMDLLPRMDGGTFTVSIETFSGTSLARTVAAVEDVQAILMKQPEVELIQSQAGFESGMIFSGGSGVLGATQGLLSVTLSPRTERDRSIWEIEKIVREDIQKIPGIANAVVKEVGNTAKPTTAAPIVARLSGHDPLVLDAFGDEVVQRLAAVDGVVQPNRVWRRDLHRVRVQVDPYNAAAMGQTPLSIARQLAMGAEGIPAGNWSTELTEPEPIVVRYARDVDPTLEDRLAWPLLIANGADVVPIRSVATPVTMVEQGLFTSENLDPVLDILAEVDGRPLNFVVADAERALATLDLPSGYTLDIVGESNDMKESRNSILAALAMSALAVYLLLVAQFRSWIHPITVMMAIPLSLAGVAAALWLTGKPVSMPVMVGLVLLVGIVVNNSILLVDVIRRRREEGMGRHEAVREGVASRFRPIMMTSMSTVIGMLPLAMELALGSERFSPLATAVIGGLLASTLLTLVVIPILYDLADGLTRRGGKQIAAGSLVCLALIFTVVPNASAQEATPMEDAWEMVLQHPAARAADQRVNASEARIRASKGRFGPQVDLQARVAVRDRFEPEPIQLPIQLPNGESPDPMQIGESYSMMYSVGASLTQPIYAGGAIIAGRHAAEAGLEANMATREQSKAELWASFSNTWYSSIMTRQIVSIREEVLRAAEAREASVTRLRQAGRATESELAVVTLKRVEAAYAVSEATSRANAVAKGLQTLVGDSVRAPDTNLVETAKHQLIQARGAGQAPELTSAWARVRAAEAQEQAIRSAALPTVALRLSAQMANPDLTQFPIRAEWGSYWDAALILHWTLDSGVRVNDAKAAKLDAAAAHFGAEALQRQLQIEEDQTNARLQLSEDRLNLAQQRIEVAQRALRSVTSAYEAGRAPIVDVLEREADLAMARAAQLSVAVDIILDVETARRLRGEYGVNVGVVD